MIDRLRRDPGLALLLLALVLAAALYAPTLTRGIIDYDDPWLVHDNYLLQHPSWHSLHAVVFDTSTGTRYGLGAEYLPVRDVSVMLDYALWGDWYQGFHLTNVVVYLAALALWFGALTRFGVARTIAGLAVLLFAVHPAHAESVAWLSERKGLLALAWTGAAAFAYASYRAGARGAWLAAAAACAVLAVWSKAPAAFALAGLAGFELALPMKRVSWRRSLVGLAVMGGVAGAAFVPVVATAVRMSVVAGDAPAPGGWLALVLGVHGFYLKLAAMGVASSVSYPITTLGPSVVELVLGGVGLAGILAAASSRRVPGVYRAAAIFWLVNWFPNSRIALPVVKVLVADRYLMFGSLAVALAAATGIVAIANTRLRALVAGALVVTAAARTLDAQSTWQDALSLWERAVRSNPDDGVAWSFYAEQLAGSLRLDLAQKAIETGLTHSRDPHLVHRQALFLIERGQRAEGKQLMREAAEGGASYAMANLALMQMEDKQLDDAIAWAKKSTQASPMYPNGYRVLGKVLIAADRPDDALVAWRRALELEPGNRGNVLNVGLALVALHRFDEARPYLEACLSDPSVAKQAKILLDMAPASR